MDKKDIESISSWMYDRDKRPGKDGWHPGTYFCTCNNCMKQFVGDKRSVVCADCAYGTIGGN